MDDRSIIEWFECGERAPPTRERLLLIASAAGEPPDSQLMNKSEIVTGYWTGQYFRPMIQDYPLGTDLKVTHWAMLRHLEGIVLQPMISVE
jgi:transcriptional regulator with XRE-family HTH domain